MKRLALFLVTLFVCAGAAGLGCSRKEAKNAVDQFTGKAPIEQGKRLKKQIRDIEAERKRQSDEAMEE